MTMIPVSRDDPRVTKAARELELTMIMSAWIHAGVLYIATPYETREVPATGFGKTNTLPTGHQPPGQSSQGGPTPPQEPEPPNPLPSGRGQGEGLDDFTAIDGVGPVTTSKLHTAGLYTYDDLRHWLTAPDMPSHGVSDYARNKIRAWLDQRAET